MIEAVAGGALIGLAASALLLSTGRIAGVSSIFGDALRGASWQIFFVAGLAAGGLLMAFLRPGSFERTSPSPAALLVGAGLLVGFGTRLGSGCTSGHGLCGMGRLSARSAVATATFMGVAAACVFVVRHVLP